MAILEPKIFPLSRPWGLHSVVPLAMVLFGLLFQETNAVSANYYVQSYATNDCTGFATGQSSAASGGCSKLSALSVAVSEMSAVDIGGFKLDCNGANPTDWSLKTVGISLLCIDLLGGTAQAPGPDDDFTNYCFAKTGGGSFRARCRPWPALTLRPTPNPASSPANSPNNSPASSPNNNPAVSPNNNPAVSPNNNPAVSPNNNPATSPNNNPATSPNNNPATSPNNNPAQSPNDSPATRPSVPPAQGSTSAPGGGSTPVLSPTSAPVILTVFRQCRPGGSMKRKACVKRINFCRRYGVILKYAGPGCTDPFRRKRRMGDGGCQCSEYCGFNCPGQCNLDPKCSWNTTIFKCQHNGQLGVPAKPVPTCFP